MYQQHQTLFQNLMSPSKELRDTAEKTIESFKVLPIHETLPTFHLGMSSSNIQESQLATLMFKKVYLDNKTIKSTLTLQEITQLKQTLKEFITFPHKEWKSLQRIADALAQLYEISDMVDNFKEISQWINMADQPLARRFGIYLIEVLCDLEALGDNVVSRSISDFIVIFRNGMADSDGQVRVSTIKAVSQFLINIKDEAHIMQFITLIEDILNNLVLLLSQEEQAGKAVLDALNYLTETHPKFWKEKIEVFLDVMCKIIKEKQLQSATRSSALELVYSLTKHIPAVLRKSNNFQHMFIPLIFTLLLEIDNENNLTKWESLLEEDEHDLTEMFYVIKSGFERLSINLGGKYFMNITSTYIQRYLQSQNWIEVQAAFTAIASISEGCKKMYKENLLTLLNYISNGLVHEHPRVRHSALIAFAAVMKETAPKAQKDYTNNILPGLAVLMTDKETSIKVKSQACIAMVEYLRGLLVENRDQDESTLILQPYSEQLITLLSSLFEYSLQCNYPPMQEATLNSLSLLANVLENNFAPYYNKIMPGLKKLYYSLDAQTPEQKVLKSHCIETISYLFSSVSENSSAYMNDLKEIADAFTKDISKLPEEDPQLTAILNAYSHISLAMEKEFVPVLEYLLPFLSKYITADIGLTIEDTDVKEYIPEDEKDETERAKIGSIVVNVGTKTKTLSLHTFALQNKILSFQILNEICLNMSKSFFPFCEKVLHLTKELLKFPFSRALRKVAIQSVYSCMNTCNEDEQREKILQFVKDDILNVLKYNVSCLYYREIKTYLKTFINCCKLFKDKTALPFDFVKELYVILASIVKATKTNINKLRSITTANDGCFDENDEDDQKADINKLNEINRRVMELNGIIFALYATDVNELVKTNLFDFFITSWKEANTNAYEQQALTAICFADDYLEYANINEFNCFVDEYIVLAKASTNAVSSEDVLQSVVYGYGVIAQRCQREVFVLKYKEEIMNVISSVIQRAKNDVNEDTFDNAVGAMGKYVYYQCDNTEENVAMAGRFVSMLPVKGDLEESKKICGLFCEKVLENNALIVNDVNCELVKNAIERIITFNKSNSFLEENIEKLIMATLHMGMTFE